MMMTMMMADDEDRRTTSFPIARLLAMAHIARFALLVALSPHASLE